MAARKEKRGPMTAMEKMEKKLKEIDPYFVESVYASKDEDLSNRMGQYAKDMTAIENARDDDESLKEMKEQLKIANQTYSEPLTAIKMKRKYIYKVLGERGKLP